MILNYEQLTAGFASGSPQMSLNYEELTVGFASGSPQVIEIMVVFKIIMNAHFVCSLWFLKLLFQLYVMKPKPPFVPSRRFKGKLE